MTNIKTSHIFLFLFFIFFDISGVYASVTEGSIDSVNKWAWSENTGWIDFGTSGGNIKVTDSALTGYAYGENIGWVSLNCSNTGTCGDNPYAVSNNGSGSLSGYAWGSNTGWINFAPSGGGVSVNSSGVFSGTAYGENIGRIVFNTDHPVTTDWRPSSSRTPVANTSGGNGPPLSGSMSYGYVSPNLPSIPTTVDFPVIMATTTPPTQIHSSFLFTRNYKFGDSGQDIKNLQVFLNTHGAIVSTVGAGSPGSETVYFGARTRTAVAAFQKANGIVPASGYFGPLTRGYINSHY
jgi:hypothetical protein